MMKNVIHTQLSIADESTRKRLNEFQREKESGYFFYHIEGIANYRVQKQSHNLMF